MSDPRNDITSLQLMSFVVSAQIGIGILSLPSVLARKAGHDGWISVIAGGFICLICSIIITLLLKRYIDKSIFGINCIIYGSWVGTFLNGIFLLYLLFITGITLRVLVEAVNIIILRFTPQLVITGIALISTVYGISKGLKVICRYSVLLFFSYMILILTLILALKYVQPTYLLPVGKAGLSGITEGVKASIYAFLGFELAAVAYPNVKDKEKITGYICAALIFTTLYYVLAVVISVMIFGETKLSMLIMAVYSVEHILEIPVVERLDTLYIFFWLPTMAATVRAYLFSAYYGISEVFRLKRNNPLIFFTTSIVIIISRLPKSFNSTLEYADYAGYIGAAMVLIIIVTYLISFLKKKVNS